MISPGCLYSFEMATKVLWLGCLLIFAILTPAFGSLHGSKCAPTVAEFLFPTAEGEQQCFACQLGNHFKQISVMRF